MEDKRESTEILIDWKGMGIELIDITPKRIRTLHGKIVRMRKMLLNLERLCHGALEMFRKGEIKEYGIPFLLFSPDWEKAVARWNFVMNESVILDEDDEDGEEEEEEDEDEDEDERAEKAQEGRGKM